MRIRAPFLTLEHCPRCVAKLRVPVAMTVIEGPADRVPPDAVPAEGSTLAARATITVATGQRQTSVTGLAIKSRRDAETVVLALAGELDIASVSLLNRRLDDAVAAGVGHIVIDLSDLKFLDSTGLEALLSARQRLQADGGDLTVRWPQPAVRRLFELTCTLELFGLEG